MRHTFRQVGFVLGFAVLSISSVAAASPDAKIARVWQAKCAACHGEDGKGATTKGKEMEMRSFATADWQKELTDQKIKDAIVNGVDRKTKDGKAQKMDGYSAKLKPEQVDGLVALIRSLAPAK